MYGRLYQELKKHGVTQSQIAEKLGVSRFTTSHKLSGKSEFTSSEMYKICEVIKDVPMQELFKKD